MKYTTDKMFEFTTIGLIGLLVLGTIAFIYIDKRLRDIYNKLK